MNALPSGLLMRERERSIRRLASDWEAIFGALRDGVAVLDGTARVVRVNPAFRAMLAVPARASLIGIRFEDLLVRYVGPSGRRASEAAFARPNRPVEVVRGSRTLELRVSLVEPELEAAVGFVVVVSDVSAQRALEAQRLRLKERMLETRTLRAEAERLSALERMKTNLLNLVSHELRGPVTVMAGYVDLLNGGDLGPVSGAVPGVVALLQEQIVRMNELISDLLDVARLDERRLRLELRTVDLNAAVQQVVREQAQRADAGGRIRVVAASGDVPVQADPARLTATVRTLIDNAIKFSPAEVEAKVWTEESWGCLTVVDVGAAIPPAEREAIFTRFGRQVTRSNAHLPGTGLRLYMAREIARLLGGDVTVDSDWPTGNRFTLRLPLAARDRDPS